MKTGTDLEMLHEIIRILDEGTPEGHSVYDIIGIRDACHREAGGWNMALVSTEHFWHIVQAIDAANRSHPRKADGVTAESLLNAMIANYAAMFSPRDEDTFYNEAGGRFDTLLHAVIVIHPDWTPKRASEWLIEHIDELRLSRIDD